MTNIRTQPPVKTNGRATKKKGCRGCGEPRQNDGGPRALPRWALHPANQRVFDYAARLGFCAQCELVTRRWGLWWCGVPYPVRLWRKWFKHEKPPQSPIGLPVLNLKRAPEDDRGCGCCLNAKWRMKEQHCPYGAW